MAGGLAHEINNPLAILSGHCQQLTDMIETDHYDAKRLIHLVEVMTRNITRIENIIHGLRRLSRNDETDSFDIAQVDQIILDAAELCGTKFQEHGIQLNIPDIAPTLNIECRATQISQVILNLLANAHDAVLRQEQKCVDVDVRETDETVLISVEDTGPGVDAQVLNKIFDPFFTTKPPGEGVGVGLSISRRIIEAHNGKLFLDQTSRKTRFVAQLQKSISGSSRIGAQKKGEK
jgi:signal transduction histidine kinase